MNLGQVAGLVHGAASGREVYSLPQVNGSTISPARILAAIEEVI